MTWKDTMRDTLISTCPPEQDIDLPGDGERSDIGLIVLAVCCAISLLGVAALVSWVAP